MSDDEEVYSEEEEEEDPAPAPSGPTEAELAMKRRQKAAQISSEGLDEAAKELLEANAAERDMMAQEIEELRARSEQRKKERLREEQEMQARREEEEARRKQEEVERKRVKEEQERERKAKRDEQMKEFAKMQDTKANFVIIKKSKNELVGGAGDGDKMSKEQMEQERKAILTQRIQPLEIDGFDEAKPKPKAENLHREILRLEGEKYDLEKRFREQQHDMLEMAERARQINKVGKTGLKRVVLKDDERDTIQERFSGAPSRIELYSAFERQPDKRSYSEKHTVFTGPTYLFPAARVAPKRKIKWDPNSGLPSYEDLEGFVDGEPAEGGETAAAEEE